MGMVIDYTTDAGISLPDCYIRVTRVDLDDAASRATFMVNYYKDKAARDSNKNPVIPARAFEVFDFPSTTPGVPAQPAVPGTGQLSLLTLKGNISGGEKINLILDDVGTPSTSINITYEVPAGETLLRNAAIGLGQALSAKLDQTKYLVYTPDSPLPTITINSIQIGIPFEVIGKATGTLLTVESKLLNTATSPIDYIPPVEPTVTYAKVYAKYFDSNVLAGNNVTPFSSAYEYLKTLPEFTGYKNL